MPPVGGIAGSVGKLCSEKDGAKSGWVCSGVLVQPPSKAQQSTAVDIEAENLTRVIMPAYMLLDRYCSIWSVVEMAFEFIS